jgi:alpha-L-fucosidase
MMDRVPEVTMEVTPEMWGVTAVPHAVQSGRGAWFPEAKFGMFIHWGLYSELGGRWQGKAYHGIGEWIQWRARIPAAEYAQVARRFNPVGFNARDWIRQVQDAGMRYLVITAKHHDGFAMFKSAASAFNIVDSTPFKRDPLAELAEACRDVGLPLGFYYSQTQDWHEPDAVGNAWDAVEGERRFDRYLAAKALPQIEELLRNYGDVAILWFDTPGPITSEDSLKLQECIRTLQPTCMINSRIGNGLGDYETLGDQEIPRQRREGLWETIDTHNDTWGYVAHDLNWKSPGEIVRRLAQVAACGGNYVLNVGPDGCGRIPVLAGRILQSVGRWLVDNGSALYGSSPAAVGSVPWGVCTARSKTLYAHVFDWPIDGRLIVPVGNGLRVRSARCLRNGTPLALDPLPDHAIVRTPVAPPDALVSVLALEMEAPARAEEAMPTLLNGWPLRLEAANAEVRGCQVQKRSWMEKFGDWKHAECLQGWDASGGEALWTFQSPESGAFYLDVEYSSPVEESKEGSEWQLLCRTSATPFLLPGTGEMPGKSGGQRPLFRVCRIGLVEFAGGTRQTLSIRSTDAAQVGVRSMTLTPVRMAP